MWRVDVARDGRWARNESFDLNRYDDAKARYDEPTLSG